MKDRLTDVRLSSTQGMNGGNTLRVATSANGLVEGSPSSSGNGSRGASSGHGNVRACNGDKGNDGRGVPLIF